MKRKYLVASVSLQIEMYPSICGQNAASSQEMIIRFKTDDNIVVITISIVLLLLKCSSDV